MADIAAAQLGVVSREQLREAGLSDAMIEHAVALHHLHPVFHTTFGVGHQPITRHGKLLAATLACGPGTVVSHGTAAWLLGLSESRPREIDVIAPVERGRKIPEIRRRFVPPPADGEAGIYKRVPTTGAARTLVDLAGSPRNDLAAAIEQAAILRVLDLERIDAILDGPRRRGVPRLQRALSPWRGHPPGARFRSRIETKLFPLLAVSGLPIPETNAHIFVNGKRYEVDFLWRRQKLIVETDSRRFHNSPGAAVRDAERNRLFPAAGYRLALLGWEEPKGRPRPGPRRNRRTPPCTPFRCSLSTPHREKEQLEGLAGLAGGGEGLGEVRREL